MVAAKASFHKKPTGKEKKRDEKKKNKKERERERERETGDDRPLFQHSPLVNIGRFSHSELAFWPAS